MNDWVLIIGVSLAAIGLGCTSAVIYDQVANRVEYARQRALRRHRARFRRGCFARVDTRGLRPGDDPQSLATYLWHGALVQVIEITDDNRAIIELPSTAVASIGIAVLRPADSNGQLLKPVPRGTFESVGSSSQ